MIDVVEGYCALKTGSQWIGVIQGNKFCKNKRKEPKKALNDAKNLLKNPNLP